MNCLRKTRVKVELSRFKPKEIFCPICKQHFVGHEEKETDVAIAIKLFELCYSDACDTAILMTGDTDLAPAVRTCMNLFPEKRILFAFPYKRHNAELKRIAPNSFSIKLRTILINQFSDPLTLNDGTEISKPKNW